MVAAGSITVAVRVRPPTSWEAARLPEPCYESMIRGEGALSTPAKVVNTAPLRDIVQIVDDRILTFDPNEKDPSRAFVERGFLPPGTKRYKDKRFMFDKVFNNEARQQDVYEATAQPLLKGIFDGYNATVFAYGATGCGKTHTISGTESDPGIIYLTMADLFQRIEDRRDEWDVEVMVTFLEIYNEEIRDLLAEPGSHAPRGGLSIREDKTVKVVGLVELKPRSAEEVKEIVLQGNLRRTQSPTHANETSSRSHAVLQVHVTQSPRTAALTEQRTMATLSIIDLAGSERAAATTNMGQRMVEGANINKSLLALGNCINALCESGGAIRHVPYRNSKLTRLLKFSLGGNCKTVMIVCVAPTSNHFDDTHNTLVYAERATKIKTKVVTRNVVNVDRHVGRYVEAINRLNMEILELKARIAGKRDAENEIARRKKAEANAEVERAKSDMKLKAEQTKESMMDGAICSGTISVANTKLRAIRARLAHIDAKAASSAGSLSSDLEAERALLQSLAGPEEQVTKPDSPISTRLHRASNSSAMFDATMRAVSERKSEKLDEVSVENVKLDAMCRKAEMEKLKAERERDVMREAVEGMADMVVNLVGMLGRCTVMVGEAANVLSEPMGKEDGSEISAVVSRVAKSLGSVKDNNDQSFKKLVGASTEGYANVRAALSSLEAFNGYGTTFTRRISSGPAVLQSNTIAKPSRRSSAFGTNSLSVPESRRPHRSPRKSLRSSLSQPYRRVSDKENKALKGGKNVQWKDEAGQGDLDDGGPKPPVVAVTIIPASPSLGANAAMTSTSNSAPVLPQRCTSLGSSESDWEDENEKTDDSVSISLTSASLPSSNYDNSFNLSTISRSYGAVGAKRPRPSRLDPSFLKSRSRGSALGSLAEGDESTSPERRPHAPLSDMNMNQLSSAGRSFSTNSLHVPKARDRGVHGSPSRRGPSTPKIGGMASGSGVGTAKGGNGRRRSNIGPMRNEKGRRRSSMIPQLSPPVGEGSGAARRVILGSPAKRTKRVSLTKSMTLSSLKLKALGTPPIGANSSMTSFSVDPNASADMSFSRKKATWR
ncbi:Kinesin-like protein 6 [Hypsizygus marmoreus]|uniref:Kinesin-like protein 6 n=1 Tax=Hypsizygus marmoreus TaxID=39966 RepID=A0A369JRN6_HYPMA|nr:Kinesin-like protein 6 [Hypsizygus marmoreus]